MSDIIRITDANRADVRFQDGALPHAAGVKSFQILRANRNHPEWADDFGWTYNHAAMLAHAYGKFFCEYLSNPVDEHEVPGHTMLCVSEDGMHWSKPLLAFPEVEVPTAQYKGPRTPELKETMLTVPHQRMGFYLASNGMLLMLSFYGIVHDRYKSMPCDGWGVGRAVRRIHADGTMDENIYFLIYNESAGYTAENTPVFAPYTTSPDAAFVAACDELLANGAVVRQMYEEQRFDQKLFPTPGAEALSFYTVSENEMIGMYKKSLVSVSHDQGKTWTLPAFQPSIHTASGKVWGQRTSDGKFTLMYNPTPDGQHRWPIAAVTGTDGHNFSGLAALTADMGPQRYGGIDKNLGPQYLRGIAECNEQAPDGDVWLVYSNNKEDIWISHIPVPLTIDGPLSNQLTLENELPASMGVYAPAWAPVSVADGVMTMKDRDPYDYARVEHNLGCCEKGVLHMNVQVDSVAPGAGFTLEMQDEIGRMPIKLVFRADGKLYVRADGRIDPWIDYTPGKQYALTVRFDNIKRRFDITLDDQEKSFTYSASINNIARFQLTTKERIPALSTIDSIGKYGNKSQVLPNCDEPTAETVVHISSIGWDCQAAQSFRTFV